MSVPGDNFDNEALDGLTDQDTLASDEDEIELGFIDLEEDPSDDAHDDTLRASKPDSDDVVIMPPSPFSTGNPAEPIRDPSGSIRRSRDVLIDHRANSPQEAD